MEDPSTQKQTIVPPSLGTLRNALVSDLRNLPVHVIAALVPSSNPDGTKTLGCSLDVAYAVVQGLMAGQDAWQLLLRTTVQPPGGLASYATQLVACRDVWNDVAQVAKDLGGLQNPPPGQSAPPLAKLLRGRASEAFDAQPQGKVSLKVLTPLAHTFVVSNQMAKTGVNDRGIQEVLTATFRVVAQALTEKYCKGKSDQICAIPIDEARGIAVSLAEGQWSNAVMGILTAAELRDTFFREQPQLRLLLATVATIAESQDSDGVEAAMEHYAAPVGSWRQKHESSGIGLLGLVGANFSHEKVLKSSSSGGTVAPTLAVGFDVYVPANPFRVGLQFPMIDVGNVASVRYDPDSSTDVVRAKVDPEVNFAQLLAPGAYAFVSLGRSPFFLAGGCSWIPSLRTVVQNGVGEQHAVLRCGGTLGVDVTIMPMVKF
jgi:hypothetical protein